jgi:uncharacterized membrane protein HdeD (DUF308 family)
MTTLEAGLKRATGASLLLSVLLIIFGVFAIALPIVSSIGVAIVVGWLVILAGITQLIHAFRSEGVGHIVWKLIVAALYLVAGVYLLAHPALGAAGLALVLGVFLFAEGIADVFAYFSTPKRVRSPWMLVDGVITLVLGFLIWNQWPSNSLWVIGTLVGISMVMTGIARFMMTLAVRRLVRHPDVASSEPRAAA